eukprot:1256290-Prymnesium_polylepis.1
MSPREAGDARLPVTIRKCARLNKFLGEVHAQFAGVRGTLGAGGRTSSARRARRSANAAAQPYLDALTPAVL